MYCNYCGKQIQDDARLCAYCGKQVGYSAAPPQRLMRPAKGSPDRKIARRDACARRIGRGRAASADDAAISALKVREQKRDAGQLAPRFVLRTQLWSPQETAGPSTRPPRRTRSG